MSTIFFDLDGTLCDSLPGVAETIQQVLGYQAQPTIAQIRSAIGPPVSMMFRKLVPGLGDDRVREFEAAFRRAYDGGNWRKFEWYPGVEQTLQRLHQQGSRLFIFTNKPEKAMRRIIESEPLGFYFEGVLSRDSRNPIYHSKSELLQELVTQYKVDVKRAVVVGDGEEDFAAARSLCLPFVFARYGYGTALEGKNDCFRVINEFHELIEICNSKFATEVLNDR